jgi:hypothetical protein
MSNEAKSQFKIGDIVIVTPEVKVILAAIIKNRHDAEVAFATATRWLASEEEKFWDTIRQAHPELANYDVRYRHKDGELKVMRRLRGGEDDDSD